MTDDSLPPIQSYQPATFRERGLAVPFTTALLAGARVRAACGPRAARVLELVVPNPSGGRGVYVMQWERVAEVCKPTLHDQRLGTALETHHRLHGELTPSEIRRVTRNVVREGLAGRAAATAARAAECARASVVGETHARLLRAVAASDGGGALPVDAAAVAARARRAMAPVALDVGHDVDGTEAGLERLAHVMAELGIDAADRAGVVGRTLAAMEEMAALVGRRADNPAAADARAAAFIVAHAELAASLARRAAEAARARARPMPAGLAEWLRRPAVLTEAAARPEWVLDGWHRICLIWNVAAPGTPASLTIAEMAALVPLIPPQAEEWLDLPPGTATQAIPPQQGTRGSPGPDGRAMDVVARNEHLLALAA